MFGFIENVLLKSLEIMIYMIKLKFWEVKKLKL